MHERQQRDADSDSKMYKIGHEEKKKKSVTKNKLKLAEDEDSVKKISVIVVDDDEEERRRLERKKRSQEEMVNDFVKILEQMMKPRQAVMSFISAAAGLVSVIVSLIYKDELRETAEKSRELVAILIAYGILQIGLASAFFVTCMQTSIAVSKGVKDAFQIVVGLLVALIYVLIALVSLVVGVLGFYKALCMVSSVNYYDVEDPLFCPKPLFYTTVAVFVLHIIMIVFKCCCCK